MMLSIFDSFVEVTSNDYALTILMNNDSSKTMFSLEHVDEKGNRALRLFEFIPGKPKGRVCDYNLSVSQNESRQTVNDMIKTLNMRGTVSPNILCTTSTYCIKKYQVQTLLAYYDKNQVALLSDNSFDYTTEILSSINIKPSRTFDNDPQSGPRLSSHFALTLLSSSAISGGLVAIFTISILAAIGVVTCGTAIAVGVIGGIVTLAGAKGLGFFTKKNTSRSMNDSNTVDDCKPLLSNA